MWRLFAPSDKEIYRHLILSLKLQKCTIQNIQSIIPVTILRFHLFNQVEYVWYLKTTEIGVFVEQIFGKLEKHRSSDDTDREDKETGWNFNIGSTSGNLRVVGSLKSHAANKSNHVRLTPSRFPRLTVPPRTPLSVFLLRFQGFT